MRCEGAGNGCWREQFVLTLGLYRRVGVAQLDSVEARWRSGWIAQRDPFLRCVSRTTGYTSRSSSVSSYVEQCPGNLLCTCASRIDGRLPCCVTRGRRSLCGHAPLHAHTYGPDGVASLYSTYLLAYPTASCTTSQRATAAALSPFVSAYHGALPSVSVVDNDVQGSGRCSSCSVWLPIGYRWRIY